MNILRQNTDKEITSQQIANLVNKRLVSEGVA